MYHSTQRTVIPAPTFVGAVQTSTCTFSFFSLLSLTLSFSCCCSVSQLGACLNIITSAIKSKQWGRMRSACQVSRFPHRECCSMWSAVLIVVVFILLHSTNGLAFFSFFWRDRAPAVRAQSVHVALFLNGNPPSLQTCSFYHLACALMKMTSCLVINLISFCENLSADGTSEWYNWVNELHALISCSLIWAAQGMTSISLLRRLLYVWWVPWREY